MVNVLKANRLVGLHSKRATSIVSDNGAGANPQLGDSLIVRAESSRANLELDGFAQLKGFLDPEETSKVRTLVDETLKLPHETACARPNNMLVPLRWNDPIVQLLLRSESRIRELSRAMGADDLKWISGYISIKEARSPALWWHSDWWCWDHAISFRREAAQVAVLTYLDDTSEVNGALRVLPGSHHASTAIHAVLPEAHSRSAEELDSDHEAMKDLPDEVTLGLGSGDAAVIDYRLLHGTHPNSSQARRDCILLSFTPSWRRLPDDLKSHLVQHPALPYETEHPEEAGFNPGLLPTFDGPRRSLTLSRNAPAQFEMSE
ncbi:MAG: phytanoyl-CoA dioxygenase family protein [Thermoplasmata archaeon]|nr:phytanoyl-CoA dioxygenase family protein [Thermoplasmata archaeon]